MLDRARLGEALDHVALLVRAGIAARRGDDADARAAVPFGRLLVLELPARGREQVRHEVAAHPAHDALRLRIAEAAVELEHARAGLGDHQPGVQHAAELDALDAQSVQRRQQHAALDLAHQPLRDEADGRHQAHAAGVRADVAVLRLLVVHHRLEQAQRRAVGDHLHGELAAGDELLDHDLATRLAERLLLHQVVDHRAAGARVVDDEHALARGEPVGLDHLRPEREALEVRLRRAGALEAAPRAGRDAVAVEELLREHLRALEARARAPGTEYRDAALAQLVGEAERQRLFRPDDDEIGALLTREPYECVDVVRRHRHVARDARRAGVPRRAHDLLHERRARDLPGERVLAPPRADDQDLEGSAHRDGKGPKTRAGRRAPRAG